jgi:predicted transcriptional regulator
MKSKKVKDMVIPLADYPHMGQSGTLREAIAKLHAAYESGHHTVLVFDDNDRLLGMLFEKDVLQGLEPRFVQCHVPGVPVAWNGLLESKSGWQERLARPVKEFLKQVCPEIEVEGRALSPASAGQAGWPPALPTVEAGDNILKAAHIMVQQGLYLLPVMDGDRIVGVVRMGDVFRAISQYALSL